MPISRCLLCVWVGEGGIPVPVKKSEGLSWPSPCMEFPSWAFSGSVLRPVWTVLIWSFLIQAPGRLFCLCYLFRIFPISSLIAPKGVGGAFMLFA